MDSLAMLGGMGRVKAERARHANLMSVRINDDLGDEVEVRQRKGQPYVHVWVTDRLGKKDKPALAIATLTATEARKLAVALRTAASRIETDAGGRTAR